MAMENCPFIDGLPIKIVIFHGYVSHNQMVTYAPLIRDQSQDNHPIRISQHPLVNPGPRTEIPSIAFDLTAIFPNDLVLWQILAMEVRDGGCWGNGLVSMLGISAKWG